MSRAIGGFFRSLFLLALLGVVSYNTWQTRQLQAEVVSLRQQVAQGKPAKTGKTLSTADAETTLALPAWLGEAQTHIERARAFLRMKRYADAQAEIVQFQKSLKETVAKAQKNGQAVQNESREAAQKVQRAAENLSTQAETLWKQINAASPPTGDKRGHQQP